MLKKYKPRARPKETLSFIKNLPGLYAIMLISNPVLASDGSEPAKQLSELKRKLEFNQKSQAALENRLAELENNAKQNSPAPAPVQSNNMLKIGLSGLFSVGQSSVDNSALENLQGEKTYSNGLAHKFWVQQLANATLCLAEFGESQADRI